MSFNRPCQLPMPVGVSTVGHVLTAAWQVGQKIKIQINRQGRPQAVELTLAERDAAMD